MLTTYSLVALSGLNGHAFGSFKAKGLNFMWIRDNLARDLQKCRLFIYGYDTNLVQSASRQTILDLGTQFAESLKTLSMSERPLILLGHSLGGLVLEQVRSVPKRDSYWTPGNNLIENLTKYSGNN